MFQQYFGVKQRHPDAILFFRMGDFFEVFHDDAVLAARLLDITLTARGPKDSPEPQVPMAGVPAHAVDGYVARLVKLGHRVVLCDQVEDARKAKGLVRREVTRIATPGTTADEHTVDAKEHVFLMAVVRAGTTVGFGFAELSTGRLDVSEVETDLAPARLADEIARYRPREILIPAGTDLSPLLPVDVKATRTERPAELADRRMAAERLRRHLGVTSLAGYGLEGRDAATTAAGLLLAYLEETQRGSIAHVRSIAFVDAGDYLQLDAEAVRNLELVRSLRDGSTRTTLLEVVDATCTSMGARLLRERLLRPHRDRVTITAGLDAVETLHDDGALRGRLRQRALTEIRDLERLLSRVTLRTANARDLLALRDSIRALPRLKEMTAAVDARYLRTLSDELDELADVRETLERSIADDAPVSMRDGGLLRKGFDAKLDELRSVTTDGKSWIAAYEGRERQETGISSLRVRFNRVFGYSIEVTKANLGLVPERYQRRQTLANAERYTTPELKEREAKVLEAEERLIDLEQELFIEIRERIAAEAGRIATTARAVATIDLLASFAEVAAQRGWVRPTVTADGPLVIEQGRHPVVEAGLVGERFVPNDVRLDPDDRQIVLVTGPNMGGKSTYLRQVALIAILAHVGSFVPARAARIPIVDRVFTRVGASDDLARGRSTFMVEMIETANILHHATSRSLVVLDEVGRGTSTFDGLSLAWAIVEHLHEGPRARPLTLFATHYHELTDLAGMLDGVHNSRMIVRSHRGEVVFAHRVEDGAADRSYGIEVARLAGLPQEVVERAREVLRNLEAVELGLEERLRPDTAGAPSQLTLFVPATHPVIEELKRIDSDSLSPLEALTRLAELSRKAREEI